MVSILAGSKELAESWYLANQFLRIFPPTQVTGSILYKNVDPENVNAGKMTTIVADTTILAEQNQKAHGDRD